MQESTPIIATVLAALYLPVPPTMLWLHGLQSVWRRIGRGSYVLHALVYLGLVTAVAAAHDVWSTGAWPVPLPLRIAGGGLVAGGIGLLAASYRQIDSWTAMAGRQLFPGGGRRLATRGVYSRVRHPRYLVLIVGGLGNFLITGYPLLLAALVVTALLLVPLIRLEERELLLFFGDEYRTYKTRVPGLFPRFTRRGRTTGRAGA